MAMIDSKRNRIDFPVNTQNLRLELKPNEYTVPLRDKLEANYLK